MRSQRPPLVVLILTALAISVLYVPQPLLPTLALAFGVGAADTSLLITLAMLPLGLAPLVYGYVLEKMPARPMMIAATLVLAATQAGMALSDNWPLMLVLRGIQGLALPALLTASMTFITASAHHEHVRNAAAWYVATTIVGGFLGRALSGLLAELWDWRTAVGTFVPLLLLAALGALRLPHDAASRFGRVTPAIFREVLGIPGLKHAYLAIFCIFFVFAALLNVLPFRLATLDPEVGAATIGLAYLGYLSGLSVSLGAPRIRRWFRTEARTITAGMLLYATGLGLLSLPSIGSVYIAMFVFCGGMFLVHTRLSGEVNHLSAQRKGVVNGLYIAAYYLGGSIGSWLPTMLYRQTGWLMFIGVLGAMLSLAAWQLHCLHPIDRKAMKG